MWDHATWLLAGVRAGPLREVARPEQPVFQLPFLYLFGRSDSTISYMGANIYPEDVEQALFSNAVDARRLGAFCLELVDVGGVEQRPRIHVEVLDGQTEDADLAGRLRERVVSRLLAANLDFRTSVSEDPRAAEIQVRLHEPGVGPFAGNHGRIKRRYIVGQTDPAGQPGSPPPPPARPHGPTASPSPAHGGGGWGERVSPVSC